MTAYYNELDAYPAQWLRNLSDADQIARGVVDERDIRDVQPTDLRGYRQCHFFAGIGVWSYALRLAGWPDNRPVWTGSCPCQPFSDAGSGLGAEDARHLWPAWFKLIRECGPGAIFGEQVASRLGRLWFTAVSADLETLGYTCAGVDLPAASVGAPHRRQRLFWVAYAGSERRQKERRGPSCDETTDGRAGRNRGQSHGRTLAPGCSQDGGRAYTDGSGLGEQRSGLPKDRDPQPRRDADGRGATSGMGDASGSRLERRPSERRDFGGELQAAERAGGVLGMGDANSVSSKQGSEVNGRRDSRGDAQPRGGLSGPNGLRFWSQCDWIPCRAPRRGIIYRPVEAGTFPLASRCPGDVGKIRAYGNSIVPQAAAAFIRAAMEHLRWHRRQDDSGRGDEDEKLPKD